MTFRGVLGGIGKALKWGLITLAMIYGLLLAINTVDEDASPELEALLVTPQIKADPANGYLALVGIEAPASEDIVSYGTQWVDNYNAAADKAAIKKAHAHYSATLKFRGDEKQLCNPSKTPCLPLARERADAWRKLAADNEMLLARQRRLTGFSYFEESYFPPSIESPFMVFATYLRLLELDLIALDAADGRVEAALAALETRIAFDRRALLGSRVLLTAMVASSWLRQDYAMLAEIVATRPKALVAQKARLVRMTELLEIAEIRTVAGKVMEGEFRTQARWQPDMLDLFLISGEGDPAILLNVIAKPLFKPRASQNIQARYHTALQARIRDFSPERAEAWIAQAWQDDKKGIDVIYSWRFLYNPIAKFGIAAYGRALYEDYVIRLSDLMGVMRLARLQVEIVTAGKADTDIPARIAANKALYDPYTGKPMGWDAGKRQLSFDARGYSPKGISKHIQAGI